MKVQTGKKGVQLAGSYTVEAVFVVPLVTGIIFLLIVVAMYFRDVSIARAIAMETLQEGRMLVQSDVLPGTSTVAYEHRWKEGIFTKIMRNSDKENTTLLQMRLRGKLSGQLWISDWKEAGAMCSGDDVRVTLSLKARVPMAGLLSMVSEDFFRETIMVEASAPNVTTKTRMYSTIVRTGKRVKGVKEVLGELEELLDDKNEEK